MKELISIIIPVYNAEARITYTIQSVLNQTYPYFELLLINDGSTDNSYKICEGFSEKDERVKLFSQENMGVSQARNTGIEKATGKFIVFIDSDDYIEKNTLATLLNYYSSPDKLLILGHYIHDQEKNISYLKNEGVRKPQVLTPLQLSRNFWQYYDDGLVNPPWNKLYRTSIIKENNIEFPIGVKMGEDLIFNLNYFQYINEINILDEYLYNYIQSPEQATRRVNLNISDDMILFLTEVENFINYYSSTQPDEVEWEEHNYQIYLHLDTAMRMAYRTTEISSNDQKKHVYKVIHKFKDRFPNRNFNPRNLYDRILAFLIKNNNYRLIHYLYKSAFNVKYILKK